MDRTRDTLLSLTELRTLKLRGSSDMSHSNDLFLFGEGSNPFVAVMFSNTLLPNNLESFLLNNITIIGQGEVAVAQTNQELMAEFIDCGAKPVDIDQELFGG